MQASGSTGAGNRRQLEVDDAKTEENFDHRHRPAVQESSIGRPRGSFCADFAAEFSKQPTGLRLFHAVPQNRNWPVLFGTSACLPDAALLILRSLLAAAFLGILIADMVQHFNKGYYFIYLTRWSFIVETLYLVCAVVVTIKAKAAFRAARMEARWSSVGVEASSAAALRPAEAQPQQLPILVRIMWLLWIVAMPICINVTLAYWTLVNPFWKLEPHSIGYENVFEHLLNTLLLFVEFGYSRNPIQLKQGMLLFVYSLAYALWTLVHYWAKIGVSPKHGCEIKTYSLEECPIYPVIDWHNPGKTLIYLVGILIVSFLTVFGLWCLARARDRADAARRTGARAPPLRREPVTV